MRGFEGWVLSYLLNSLWQVPLLFATGWLAARALRATGAAAEHRIWVSVLLLQSLLPAGFLLPWARLQALLNWSSHARNAGAARVSVVLGPGIASGVLHLPAGLLRTTVVLYGAACAYFIARFLWRCRGVAALRRNAFEVSLTEEAAHCWTRCSKRFGVEGASIAASSNTFGPVTLGMRRKLVLLPSHMLTRLAMADLQTVMAHECAHIRRQDFVKNLLYELLSLPVSYHPALWLTRERVIESREMVCDQMAAEIAGPSEYARSLLRLVSLLISETPATAPHAIGIFDANTFERRLMRLTEKQKSVRGVWQFAVVAACAVLGIATCASAVALSVHVHAASESHTSNTSATGPLRVPASTMAANVLIRVQPKYPEAAKAAKIQGTIVLEAIISKTGTVENLHIISGPDELQPSSLDAVRQWTYKPYLLNGDPVEVTTTIKVIYSLQP